MHTQKINVRLSAPNRSSHIINKEQSPSQETHTMWPLGATKSWNSNELEQQIQSYKCIYKSTNYAATSKRNVPTWWFLLIAGLFCLGMPWFLEMKINYKQFGNEVQRFVRCPFSGNLSAGIVRALPERRLWSTARLSCSMSAQQLRTLLAAAELPLFYRSVAS